MKPEDELPDVTPVADLDRVVHAPSRLMILAYLHIVESADFVFLMRQTGLTRGNLSSQVSTLEEAGYVEIEKTFVERVPRTLIKLTPLGRRAVSDYRTAMKKVVDDLLG